jgi:metal-dependent amidase/aminoacylase/carboxypeptidase family protein
LLEKLRACAEGAALATGATLDIKIVGHSYKAMKPNLVMGDAFVKNLAELGEPLVPPPADAGMGSTDMGDVSQVVPSIHAYIKICEEGIAAHSRAFAEAAISKRGLDVMLIAAKAMAMTGIDILTDPQMVKNMWHEFRSS